MTVKSKTRIDLDDAAKVKPILVRLIEEGVDEIDSDFATILLVRGLETLRSKAITRAQMHYNPGQHRDINWGGRKLLERIESQIAG